MKAIKATSQKILSSETSADIFTDKISIGDITIDNVFSKAKLENFPVALKVLPKTYRKKLLALYGYARLVDNLGDEYGGDRLEALNWAEKQLKEPTHPIFQQLHNDLLSQVGTDLHPALLKLIEANRMDQKKTSYKNYDELYEYCELSANPVGAVALAIFGADSFEMAQHSDSICTGLQILEHLQDIAEDFERGRIYIPETELNKYSVKKTDIKEAKDSGRTNAEMSNLVLSNLKRVEEHLAFGEQLVAGIKNRWGKLAVAGFVAGGRAEIAFLEANGGDVFGKASVKKFSKKIKVIKNILALLFKRHQS